MQLTYWLAAFSPAPPRGSPAAAAATICIVIAPSWPWPATAVLSAASATATSGRASAVKRRAVHGHEKKGWEVFRRVNKQ